MRASPRIVLGLIASVTLMPWIPRVAASEEGADVRKRVAAEPGGAKAAPDGKLDPNGKLYGVPFGATEDVLVQTLGAPSGYIRLDEKRTMLLYGTSLAFLCYGGEFDALRIGNHIVDWQISQWAAEKPGFEANGWDLGGIRLGTTLEQVKKLAKVEPQERRYQGRIKYEKALVEINFSHRTDEGEKDEAYTVYSLLVARLDSTGKDHWTQQPLVRLSQDHLRGQKLLGLMIGSAEKGLRVVGVHGKSPAAKAEIVPGDLITKLNGETLAGASAMEFTRRTSGGQTVTLEVVSREGSTRTVELTPADGGEFGSVDRLTGPTEVGQGEEAPDFEVKTQDGKTIRLSQLRGAPVLINFTATWCGPCKKETPELVKLAAKYEAEGVHFVSVYLDDASKDVFGYAKGLGANWAINTDGKAWENAVARRYGVMGVPTNVVVDKEGKIASLNVRGAALEGVFERLLK